MKPMKQLQHSHKIKNEEIEPKWFFHQLVSSEFDHVEQFFKNVWCFQECCDVDKYTNTNANTKRKWWGGSWPWWWTDPATAHGQQLHQERASLHSAETFTQTFLSSSLLRRDTGTWCWRTECSFSPPFETNWTVMETALSTFSISYLRKISQPSRLS